MARTLLLTLILSPLALPPTAAAQEPTPEFQAQVQTGVRRMIGQQLSQAVREFQAAVDLDPGQPAGHYHLGEAKRATGDLDGALSAFRTCSSVAQRRGDLLHQARCVFATADTLERMAAPEPGTRVDDGGLEAAREGWRDVLRFAESNARLVNPQIARARLTAIDQALEQERVYVDVRQRIAAREQAAAGGP